MRNIAIILSSGSGSRFNSDIPKQFYKIKNKTVLEYSIEAFQNHDGIDEIIAVTNPDYIQETKNITNKYSKVTKVVSGGETRQISSYNGVFSIENNDCNVLIHDGARPFVSKTIINECITALKEHKAVNVAIESSDTIIEVDENNIIQSVPPRNKIRRCQTPQCFDINIIKEAHIKALNEGLNTSTDDCGLILRYKLCPVYVVNGDVNNIKITYPDDIIIAEKILSKF